jgi:outer membrane protein assembly factor BamA
MKKPAYFLTALFFLAIFTLFGQEADTGGIHDGANVSELPQEQISPGDKKLYVITDFEFDIKGRTRPDALMYNGEFNKGEKIQGNACLEKYIRDKTQLLINQRVLKDNVEISYAAGEQEPDGTYPVTLTIKVEDTWNIIPLPKPEYNSNTGFNLTIKIKDYNFLGTMEPLTVDLGYSYDEDNRNSFLFGIYSDIPFRAFGFNWNFLFDNSFDYRPDVEQPF